MKLFKKFMFTSGAILCAALLLYGCSSSNNYTNTLEKIKSEGKIILGTSADYAPYEFPIINENGQEEIIGMDIDIAKEIAKDLNVELIIKNMDFNGLLDALNSNNIDFILSGMTPTEERQKNISFSDIYYTAKNEVLILDKNKDSIKSIEDLDGKVIGVQLGSIQAQLADQKFKNSKIKPLIKVPDLILELLSGKVDAVIIEAPVAKQYKDRKDNVEIVNSIDLNTDSITLGNAVGVRHGENKFLEKINSTLTRLKNENKIEEFFNSAFEKSQQNRRAVQ